MMTERPNPYEAPRSDLGPGKAQPSRRTAWRIYAYAILALQGVGLYYGFFKIDLTRALDYSATMIGIVGLFGYAYRRPFLGQWFWKSWSILLPMWDILMGVWIYPSQEPRSEPGLVMAYFVLMLLLVPEYVALVRYAYRSPEVWSTTKLRPSLGDPL